MAENQLLAEAFRRILDEFVQDSQSALELHWKSWRLNLAENEAHEVVGGLLARQVSLAVEMARIPAVWNPHVGPLILRAMIDAYITLSWILIDPQNRALKFISYGLGQVKLRIEHMRAVEDSGDETDAGIGLLEDWVNKQRHLFLTDVNVGSWSGINTRSMAEEADCLELYNSTYAVFSEAAHSMWPHISIFNLKPCSNVLHRRHSVPNAPELSPDMYYINLASRYLDMSFSILRERLDITADWISPHQSLMDRLALLSVEAQGVVSDESPHGSP